jgi:predicted metal-binding membrane protein
MPVELLFRLLRHRRAVVLGALATVIAAAWGYLLLGAGIEMEMMDMGGGQMMGMPPEWSPPHAVLISVMWVVMMVAMMLPSAAPTVLLVATMAGDRLANSNLVPATAMLFASGYLLVWCGFSLAATVLQWGLDGLGLLSETMAFGNAMLASTVLIAVGVYQWTPLKDACLRHCRSPAEFLIHHWYPDTLGAVRTGIRHGLFCLGCCWMLMALLFVGGLMNLAWVGAIALFVLLEKTMPWGGWMSRLAGLLLVISGATILVRMILE